MSQQSTVILTNDLQTADLDLLFNPIFPNSVVFLLDHSESGSSPLIGSLTCLGEEV